MRALKIIGKILLAIVSFVLCVVLFASTLVTMLVADVKVATNRDNLQNLISQTLSVPAQQTTLRPVQLAAGAGFDASSGDISGALVEYAFQALQDSTGGELNITLDQVKEFVEESTLKDFIADKSAGIISDIYTGEKTTTLSADEIVQLVTENKDLIKEHFDLEIPEDALDELKAELNNMPVLQQIQEQGIAGILMESGAVAPDEETDNTDIGDTWYGKLPGFGSHIESSNIGNNPVALALELVRFYTSDAILWLCIGVCAALIGLLFLCAWNKPYKAMVKSGITLFVASAGFLTPTLIAWLAPATWMGLFSFEPMVGSVSRFILMLTGGVCGTVAGLGVALIAGGIVVMVLMKKKKAALAAGVEEVAVVEEAPAEEAAAEEVPAEEVEEIPAAEEVSAEEAPAEEQVTEETV